MSPIWLFVRSVHTETMIWWKVRIKPKTRVTYFFSERFATHFSLLRVLLVFPSSFSLLLFVGYCCCCYLSLSTRTHDIHFNIYLLFFLRAVACVIGSILCVQDTIPYAEPCNPIEICVVCLLFLLIVEPIVLIIYLSEMSRWGIVFRCCFLFCWQKCLPFTIDWAFWNFSRCNDI